MIRVLYFTFLFIQFTAFSQTVKPKCVDGNCRNKVGTYRYADSSIYTGEFTDKMRNGKGKILFKDGSSYEGEWKMNIKDGYGTFIDSDGSKYEGFWFNDSKHGNGKYTDSKKNIFEGIWTNGELLGDILITYSDKTWFKGGYNRGKEGKGEFLYKDSSKYEGGWSKDKRNGYGKITCKSGATYEGDWINDKRQGQGTAIDSLNNKYEGTWFENKENGSGKYTDTWGNVYEGVWTNGELRGVVTISFKNRNRYEGEYNKGLQGKGKFTYNDGSLYIGNFNKNNRSGYGELSFHFGLTFKGSWVSNEIEQGDFYDSKTQLKIASGTWMSQNIKDVELVILNNDGYLVRYYSNNDLYYGQSSNGLPNGTGTIIYSSGERYEGNFLAGQLEGYGHYFYNDESEYKGEWKNGIKEGKGTLVKDNKIEEGYWRSDKFYGERNPFERKTKIVDGYKAVRIGNQIWMTENLNSVRFRNGDLIKEASNEEAWNLALIRKEPAWCYYMNDPQKGAIYGRLYNYYAILDRRGIAPVGWRIPNSGDFDVLIDSLGGLKDAGEKMKSKEGWKEGEALATGNGNNESGLNIKPSGVCSGYWREGPGKAVDFGNEGFSCSLWCTSGELHIGYGPKMKEGIVIEKRYENNYNDVGRGFSIRCIKDL